MAGYPYIDTLKGAPAFLEVCSGPRCGARGLKMFGYSFTSSPMLLDVNDLEPHVVKRLVGHPELIVTQHHDKPKELAAPEPPMRRLPGAMADRDAASAPKATKPAAKAKIKKSKTKSEKPED